MSGSAKPKMPVPAPPPGESPNYLYDPVFVEMSRSVSGVVTAMQLNNGCLIRTYNINGASESLEFVKDIFITEDYTGKKYFAS